MGSTTEHRQRLRSDRFAGWEHWPCDRDGVEFEELGLDTSLIAHIRASGFQTPRRIQAVGIRAMLTGRDVLLAAGPGSGKTLAYLAPIIHDLQAGEALEGGPRVHG